MSDTVSDILVRMLAAAGVETIFGLPGGENVTLLGAIRRQGLRFVLVRNESSAVYMADVEGRLNGRPGVCLTTLGPGAANVAAGVGHAYLDRAPVIVITACKAAGHTHQYFDQRAFFEPITKGTFTVTADNVHEVVAQALALCQNGRPGPMHLQISSDVAGAEAVPPTASFQPPVVGGKEMVRDWERGRALWSAAKRPLIVAGLGLEPERPYAALQTLAEETDAPVILTPKAKGAISADHPLYAGTIGLTRTDPVYDLIAEADCILGIGFDVVELVKAWDVVAPFIWLASWPNEDPVLPAIAERVGNIAAGLESLMARGRSAVKDWGAGRVHHFRKAQAARQLPEPITGRMRPQEVLTAVRANVPRETIVTVDVGSHKILTSLEWPTYTPNSFFLSNGLSCMGFGLPGAIAASLVSGKEPVVAILGDGGLGMVLGELNLIQELETPLIIVVMVDEALDLIRAKQKRVGERAFGTEFINPDFVKIAEAYGIAACQVSNEAACGTAVREAVGARRPILIESLIDPISYPTTPIQ